MGWCSATEIIDTAIEAAESVLSTAMPGWEDSPHRDITRNRMDRQLRPFVRKIADKLRSDDWDCQQDSDYYDRFGPEMEGMDDDEFRAHQAQQMEPEDFAAWLETWRVYRAG